MSVPAPTIYDDAIKAAGNWYGVKPEIIRALIAVESSFNPKAKAATTSAYGLMQMTRAACMDVGIDYGAMDDPFLAIAAGTKYLSRMIQSFGERDGIRAYYAGAGNLRMQREADASKQPYYGNLAQRLKEADAYLARVLAGVPRDIALSITESAPPG